MKHIGILTFHWADNYGAVLQCYALFTVINRIPGCEAEIIPFIPDGVTFKAYLSDKESVTRFKKKRKRFEDFLKDKLGIKTRCSYKDIDWNRYDCIVVGSDQIWNPKIANISEYLLYDTNEIYKISYAASIGIDGNELYPYRDVFKKYLKDFKSVSIREGNQISFLAECGINAKVVIDPSCLLDKSDYEVIMSNRKLYDESFILLFWLRQYEDLRGAELANRISRKYNLPVIHSFCKDNKYTIVDNGKNMYYDGIEEFLWYIKNAKFIITDSFHGMLFSLIFKKNFYVFSIDYNSNRIISLAKHLGIQERVVSRYLSDNELEMELDYSRIEDKFSKMKADSLQYLNSALNKCTISSIKINMNLGYNIAKRDYLVPITIPQIDMSSISNAERYQYQYPIMTKYLRDKLHNKKISSVFEEMNKKNIVLYAITEFADIIYDDICFNKSNVNVIALVDSNAEKYKSRYKGKNVIDMQRLVCMYQAGEIDMIVNCSVFHSKEIYETLHYNGIKYEDIVSAIDCIMYL